MHTLYYPWFMHCLNNILTGANLKWNILILYYNDEFWKSELILHMYNKTLIYISSLIFSDTEPQTY